MAIQSPFEEGARRRVRQRLRRTLQPAWLGTLRRTSPLSRRWGTDRGTPIDRVYIERFLADHRGDINGHVLEVKESRYVSRFGSNVTRCDVVDNRPDNPAATIVTDLSRAESIPSDTFDCCVITQTLQYIWDVEAAARELHRMLRPGGVLLVTVPTTSHLDFEADYPEYWRFTPDACARLFSGPFATGDVSVHSFGNVLTSIAFLTGMAQEDLSPADLVTHDRDFPVVVGVRAVKGDVV